MHIILKIHQNTTDYSYTVDVSICMMEFMVDMALEREMLMVSG